MASSKKIDSSDVAPGAKWRCDVCSAKFFDDYDGAKEHERRCREMISKEKNRKMKKGEFEEKTITAESSAPAASSTSTEIFAGSLSSLLPNNPASTPIADVALSPCENGIYDEPAGTTKANATTAIASDPILPIINDGDDANDVNFYDPKNNEKSDEEFARLMQAQLDAAEKFDVDYARKIQAQWDAEWSAGPSASTRIHDSMNITATKGTPVLDLTTGNISDNDDDSATVGLHSPSSDDQHSDATSSERNNYSPWGDRAEKTAEKALRTLCRLDAHVVDSLSSKGLKRKITEIQKLCKDGVDDDNDNDDVPVKYNNSCQRELMGLHDHLIPGLHDHAPNIRRKKPASTRRNNNTTTARGGEDAKRSRLAKSTSNATVVHRHRNDKTCKLISDRPVHYSIVPRGVSDIANELRKELLYQFNGRQNNSIVGKQKAGGSIASVMEVTPGSGYYKAHCGDSVSARLKSLDILPAYLQIKRSASQKSIVFFNERSGQCDTHFDRDSSALYLVSGFKEVKIARPMRSVDRPEDGILHGIDPFSEDEKIHGGFAWETVMMYPGAVIFLPKFWVHCVKSVGHPDTLALSFQVEIKEDKRHLISWEECGVPLMEAPAPLVPMTSPAAADTSTTDATTSTTDKNISIANPSKFAKKVSIKTEVSSTEFMGRRSSRQRPKCGICKAGFCGEEMWVLQRNDFGTTNQTHQNNSANYPELPVCPIELPKHLICMGCCPRQILIYTGDPATEIAYPDGKRRPILTCEEFPDLHHYGYYSASIVDYTTKYVNKGRSLLGRAGGEYTVKLAESTMIKSEF
mmetsp:Transcript_25431/g.54940  ORF Transcript_25431/g.54940 Transcript_25431/m.54940 type:complete len:805 (+) Transcript_25431:120-2534(+)